MRVSMSPLESGSLPLPREERVASVAADREGHIQMLQPHQIGERIVRCADCKFCERGLWARDALVCNHGALMRAVGPRGFCSWGVARDEA